jgi:hypothetical protein
MARSCISQYNPVLRPADRRHFYYPMPSCASGAASYRGEWRHGVHSHHIAAYRVSPAGTHRPKCSINWQRPHPTGLGITRSLMSARSS